MFKKTAFYMATALFMSACSSNKFLHQRYTNFKRGSESAAPKVAKVEHLKAVRINILPTMINKSGIKGDLLMAEVPASKVSQHPSAAIEKSSSNNILHTVAAKTEFKALADKKETKKDQKKFIFGLISSVLGLVLSILLIVLVVVIILVLV